MSQKIESTRCEFVGEMHLETNQVTYLIPNQ
jgi:hypothetical protein